MKFLTFFFFFIILYFVNLNYVKGHGGQSSRAQLPKNCGSMNYEECSKYANELVASKKECIGAFVNKNNLTISYSDCSNRKQLCEIGTEIFIPEQFGYGKRLYPGCCELCVVKKENSNLPSKCESNTTYEVCLMYAKVEALKAHECFEAFVYKEDLTINYMNCPSLYCDTLTHVYYPELNGFNKSLHHGCCPRCVLKNPF